MEGLLLALVCLSPWAYGSVHAGAQFLLDAGVAALVALWALRMLLEGEFRWQKCPIAICLAGLFLLGACQIAPLGPDLVRKISPVTAALFAEALPTPREELPLNQRLDDVAPPPGSTLSVCPFATRRELIQLLAAFLVWATIRNNLASPALLRRLSIAAVANGGLLALFGLVQFFASPRETLYWSYVAPGEVFGPFVNRNHFAFYINLCIGLACGLYLNALAARERDGQGKRPAGPLSLLENGPLLWIGIALALMISSLVFCLSRGGFLAFLGAGAACLAIRLRGSSQHVRWGMPLVILSAVLALVSWFGLQRVERRMTSATSDGAFDTRLAVWSAGLQFFRQAPIFGSGYGTYQYVEPLHRTRGDFAGRTAIHADNEYVEALVEGGVLRLGVALAAIAAMLVLGYRAASRRDPASAGLALGALFGFVTIVIHSFVDFGLHVPAVALLAIAIGANLSTLGSNMPRQYQLRLAGLAPLAAGVVVVTLAALVVSEGWRFHKSTRLLHLADQLNAFSPTPNAGGYLRLLVAAADTKPDDPQLQLDAAKAQFDAFEMRSAQLSASAALEPAKTSTETAGNKPAPYGPPAAKKDTASITEQPADKPSLGEQQLQLEFIYLTPALRQFVRARDLSPLMAEPNVWIALNVERFKRAEPRERYLQRAKELARADPNIWYLCGSQELTLADQPEAAWQSWRRCLELSDAYLAPILDQTPGRLTPEAMTKQLLPARPASLLIAATYYYPHGTPKAATDPGAPPTIERALLSRKEQRPLVEAALRLLEKQAEPRSPLDYYWLGSAHDLLGHGDEALKAYRIALAEQPEQLQWRYALARLLHEQRQSDLARSELTIVLGQDPKHAEARSLLDTLNREQAAGESDAPKASN
jgi:O-antigen ligase/tetratricopeptide (TPR) repeat protein